MVCCKFLGFCRLEVFILLGYGVSYHWVVGTLYFKTAWWSHLRGLKSIITFLGLFKPSRQDHHPLSKSQAPIHE